MGVGGGVSNAAPRAAEAGLYPEFSSRIERTLDDDGGPLSQAHLGLAGVLKVPIGSPVRHAKTPLRAPKGTLNRMPEVWITLRPSSPCPV